MGSFSTLLAEQAAIVTGGAQGIGLATCRLLAAHGARVLIADVDGDKAKAAANEIGETATAFAADLVIPGVPDEMVETALSIFGRLDIIVNNAGYYWDARIHKMTDEQFQAMLDIHAVVPFRVLRAAIPYFMERAKEEREQGIERFRKVVNVSSLAAVWGIVGAANYAAGKAAMIGLTKSAARELGPYKVNVNAVAFGVIQTRLGLPKSERNVVRTGGREIQIGVSERRAKAMGLGEDADEHVYEAREAPGVALGRTGTIDEAAGAIFYLCSPLSNYVHGQVHVVSGGASGGMS